ncbi:MAG: ribonuclease III [Bacteroidia bacterium]
MTFFNTLWIRYRYRNTADRELYYYIKSLTGKAPRKLRYYRKAMRHSSAIAEDQKTRVKSNERLEYLGDAVLSLLVGEYLWRKFPKASEGFLSEMRSRLTSREYLNRLAFSLQITEWLDHKVENAPADQSHSIYGNAVEALMGAIFIDQGFKFTRKFFYQRLLHKHIQVKEVLLQNLNFKSRLLEWAQKEQKEVGFDVVSSPNGESRLYVVRVLVDKEEQGKGESRRKKKAEQRAAAEAMQKLNVR